MALYTKFFKMNKPIVVRMKGMLSEHSKQKLASINYNNFYFIEDFDQAVRTAV
jgi:succinyl-CoA synthetase beta subunit